MLILYSYDSLDWGNRQEFKAACAVINENNLIKEADSGDLKVAAKQLKKKKHKQKHMGK